MIIDLHHFCRRASVLLLRLHTPPVLHRFHKQDAGAAEEDMLCAERADPGYP